MGDNFHYEAKSKGSDSEKSGFLSKLLGMGTAILRDGKVIIVPSGKKDGK